MVATGARASDAPSIWTKVGVSCLAIVAIGVLHALFFHLKEILEPFVLSVFLVLWLQPCAEAIYGRLSGREAPHRWCWCCLRRKHLHSDAQGGEAHGAETPGASPTRSPLAKQPISREAFEGPCVQLADGLCRFVAATVVLVGMLLVAVCMVLLLLQGAVHMRANWSAYRKGSFRMLKLFDHFVETVSKDLELGATVDAHMKEAYASMLDKGEEWIWFMLDTGASGFSAGISTTMIVSLYVLFWLMQPLPTGGTAGALVRSYIKKKTLVSTLYGGCVTLLFVALGIDLAVLFGIISFVFNFVPEVGAFFSMLIPIPVIILDGRIERPFLVLAIALIGQMILKFIFGNILEVKLIEEDREMRLHPVWVLLGLSYFGFIWGPTGMLISVPILAMLKTATITARSELSGHESWFAMAEQFVACCEGRQGKHHYGSCAV